MFIEGKKFFKAEIKGVKIKKNYSKAEEQSPRGKEGVGLKREAQYSQG